MRISSKSKIAFQVLLDIAAHTAQGRTISIPVICRRQGLSHSYIEAVMSELKLAGFIRSHRGPAGGYSLLKNPNEITLFDVAALMNEGNDYREDLSMTLWASLDAYMIVQMQQITLSSALSRSPIKIEQSTKGITQVKVGAPRVAQPKPTRKITKPKLGPNSVFAFGSYLKTT